MSNCDGECTTHESVMAAGVCNQGTTNEYTIAITGKIVSCYTVFPSGFRNTTYLPLLDRVFQSVRQRNARSKPAN